MDAFRNYDSWLEAPYQERYERGQAIQDELERLELLPPHEAGGNCPRCGELGALVSIAELDEDDREHYGPVAVLTCGACDAGIRLDEEPTFEPDPDPDCY